MGISNHYEAYFFIQMVLLLLSVPVILTSIYYQKYIEKKWCPICLTIMGVILVELVYVLYLTTFLDLRFSFYGAMLYLFVVAMMTASWFPLKRMLTKVNHLKEVELKANRFKRNYTMFKKMLVASEHYELPESLLVFGNPNATLDISIITSPFCGHCTEPHYMLKSILDKYGEHITVSMLYNVNAKSKRLMDFVKNVIDLNLNNGEAKYYEAMDYWYQTKDNEKWLSKYKSQTDLNQIEHILDSQQPWFSEQDLNFTPCLFVNGYRYPQGYDLKDLQFFIDELVEDESLYIKNNEIKIASPKS